MKIKNLIKVILPLLFMICSLNELVAETSTASSAESTVVVNGYYPLIISPQIPNGQNQIIPEIIYKGQKTPLAGWMQDYSYGVLLQGLMHDPFATFGVNGTKNAEVILTGLIRFAHDNDKITFVGGWVAGIFSNQSQFVPTFEVIPQTVVKLLSGKAPMPGSHPEYGGIWVQAFVSSITIDPSAQSGSNQMIFELTAAYNF